MYDQQTFFLSVARVAQGDCIAKIYILECLAGFIMLYTYSEPVSLEIVVQSQSAR